MENASKALLIAGSILIVILLIAVGMRVFYSTEGTTQQTETMMESTEQNMFNSQFLQYAGKTISGAEAYDLIALVISSNSNSSRTISFLCDTDGNGSYDREWGRNGMYFDRTKEYIVSMNLSSGYVSEIKLRLKK